MNTSLTPYLHCTRMWDVTALTRTQADRSHYSQYLCLFQPRHGTYLSRLSTLLHLRWAPSVFFTDNSNNNNNCFAIIKGISKGDISDTILSSISTTLCSTMRLRMLNTKPVVHNMFKITHNTATILVHLRS